MTISRKLTKVLAGAFFALFISVSAFAGVAEAVRINVTNVHKQQMSVAIVHFAPGAGKWRTIGWYNVTPNSTRTINFDTGNTNVIYLHAYTGNTSWGKGDITRTVIKESFNYLDGQSCKQGTNRRTVKFTKYTMQGGVVNYKPVLSK